MSSTWPTGQHFWTEHNRKTTADAHEAAARQVFVSGREAVRGEVGHGRSAMLEIVRVLPRLFQAHGSLLDLRCYTAPVGVSSKARL